MSRASALSRLRLEVADLLKPFDEAYTFTDLQVTTRLVLTSQNVSSVEVRRNDVLLASPQHYILDASNGVLVLTDPLEEADRVTVTGYTAELFTDDILSEFLDTAYNLHRHNNASLTWGTISENERYLVTLLARHEALWMLATDASYDIDIRTVEGVNIPRSQRFSQLMTMAQATKARYDELAKSLNLGPTRIEVSTLRRKSRNTGRLVPIYISREVDDTREPERVYPEIQREGAPAPVITVATYNIQMRRDKDYSEEFDFSDADGNPQFLEGYLIRARVWASKYVGDDVADFDVQEINYETGKFYLRMAQDEIRDLGASSDQPWTLEWRPPGGEWETVLQGTILIESPGPLDLRSGAGEEDDDNPAPDPVEAWLPAPVLEAP